MEVNKTAAYMIALQPQEKQEVVPIVAKYGLDLEVVQAVLGEDIEVSTLALDHSHSNLLGRAMVSNEYGCLLSHRMMWKMALEQGLDHAIFFEEDVRFTAIFEKHMEEYLQLREQGWLEHAILFFYRTVARPARNLPCTQRDLTVVSSRRLSGYSSLAYALSRASMVRLLNCRVALPVDMLMEYRWYTRLYNLEIRPYSIFPQGKTSTIEVGRKRARATENRKRNKFLAILSRLKRSVSRHTLNGLTNALLQPPFRDRHLS